MCTVQYQVKPVVAFASQLFICHQMWSHVDCLNHLFKWCSHGTAALPLLPEPLCRYFSTLSRNHKHYFSPIWGLFAQAATNKPSLREMRNAAMLNKQGSKCWDRNVWKQPAALLPERHLSGVIVQGKSKGSERKRKGRNRGWRERHNKSRLLPDRGIKIWPTAEQAAGDWEGTAFTHACPHAVHYCYCPHTSLSPGAHAQAHRPDSGHTRAPLKPKTPPCFTFPFKHGSAAGTWGKMAYNWLFLKHFFYCIGYPVAHEHNCNNKNIKNKNWLWKLNASMGKNQAFPCALSTSFFPRTACSVSAENNSSCISIGKYIHSLKERNHGTCRSYVA